MRFRDSVSIAALIASLTAAAPAAHAASMADFKHIVVIYQENHSFDNLYGQWGSVNGEPVNGPANAKPLRTKQVRQDNTTRYQCLLQLDVNLTSPSPLATTCTDTTGAQFQSHFTNGPFFIDNYIAATDVTCPKPGQFSANGFAKGDTVHAVTGGCTRDIVHRFYSEQYQINGGLQNRYVTGSDASGLAMGAYDTTKLPIYTYLHGAGAPKYVIGDSFYQAAFGGSFLNHQFLVAGAAPLWTGAVHDGTANDFHSVLDSNNMAVSTPLYTPTGTVKDSMMTQACPGGGTTAPNGLACGDYAVNTTQPFSQPFSPNTAANRRLPPLTNPTIGDSLSAQNVDWAWYSGGWSNATGNVGGPGWTNGSNGTSCTDPNANPAAGYPLCPDFNFQFHHQAFNYFANFAIGTAARTAHLKDEAEFFQAAQNGTLKPVSFIKALGEENEHPGYASESQGSSHLVDLIQAVMNGPQANDTLIVITYDEFGGQWDHVPPPPHNRNGARAAAADVWGPGTRIPVLLVSKSFTHGGVSHEDFDTTSIIKMIERKYRLPTILTRPVKSLSVALQVTE